MAVGKVKRDELEVLWQSLEQDWDQLVLEFPEPVLEQQEEVLQDEYTTRTQQLDRAREAYNNTMDVITTKIGELVEEAEARVIPQEEAGPTAAQKTAARIKMLTTKQRRPTRRC